jgi:hypothetical protein
MSSSGARVRTKPGGNPARPPSAWAGAAPELVIAVVAVAGVAAAGYALAGPQALTIVVIVAAVIALVGVRLLLPTPQEPVATDTGADSITTSWSSYRYWQNLVDLKDGMAARAAYETRLRPALEHLLAARLAERHGVNLYHEPAEARRLLCRDARDRDLWAWIDPAQAASAQDLASMRSGGTEQAGISRRTLERLINRLEQL